MIIDNAINNDPVVPKDSAVVRSVSSPRVETEVTEYASHEYAGFWIRLGASLIDSILILFVVLQAMSMLVGTADQPAAEQSGSFVLALIVFNYILPAAITLLFWFWKSATPGKMILGLEIVSAKGDDDLTVGQMFIRYIGYFPSAILLFAGFIWVAFDSEKQGLHDKLAGTLVVRTR